MNEQITPEVAQRYAAEWIEKMADAVWAYEADLRRNSVVGAAEHRDEANMYAAAVTALTAWAEQP